MTVRRVIYPPMWLLLGIAAIFVLDALMPTYGFQGRAGQIAGGAVMVVGLTLLVIAGGLFTRARTGLVPFSEATVLVTHGVYAWSRNPMYLAMALVLLGVAITVGSFPALLVAPAFAAIIQWRYILPEEAMLRERFPDAYTAYCARVRRWL